MDEIKLRISNPDNEIYKSVLLRKFFLMLFIDGKRIHAYIASVFGGLQENSSEMDKDSQKLESLLPVFQEPGSQYYLMFQIASDDELIERVESEDKTESFCSQTEWVSKVWGESERCEDKNRVYSLLRELYKDHYNGAALAKVDSGAPVYFFKGENRPLHSFLAVKGDYESVDNSASAFGYRLYAPRGEQLVTGIEVINWIKADISLKADIRKRPILFSIDFDNSVGKIYTPDFTWYLAPPAGYVIDGESYVDVKGIGVEKNAISAVSDTTDVLFDEWRKDERIVERKKSRVLFNTIPGCIVQNLSKHETLTVLLHIANPQGPSSRQFILGLLVAFLLSFCSDKTRINDYYSCLLNYCTCLDRVGNFCSRCSFICNAISVFAPVLVLMTFLVWVLDPKRCFPSASSRIEKFIQTWLKRFHFVGICLTVVLAAYVFVIWLLWPDILGMIGCYWNSVVLTIGFLSVFIMDTIYLVYCMCYLKRSIINYL